MECETLNVRELTAYPLSGGPVEGQFPGLVCMRCFPLWACYL